MEPINGLSHISIVTPDIRRLATYYMEMFDAELVQVADMSNGGRIGIVRSGQGTAINLFEAPTNTHTASTASTAPMFERGRLDHLGLSVRDEDAFYELRQRLIAHGHSDGDITSVGPAIAFEAIDPDGMNFEVNLILDPSWRDGHAPRPYTIPTPN